MLNFSGLTRYPKKSKTSDQYKELETNFLHDADKLFDNFATIINKVWKYIWLENNI